jgi:hypothetical protein
MSSKSDWGPALWRYLHIVASYCEDPNAFCGLLRSVSLTMPCPDCRNHLIKYLLRFPPESTICGVNKATVYIFDLHNHVNTLIGKPTLSRSDAAAMYGEMTVPPPPPPPLQVTSSLSSLQRPLVPPLIQPPALRPMAPATVRLSRFGRGGGGGFTHASIAATGGMPSPFTRPPPPTPARGLRYRRQ